MLLTNLPIICKLNSVPVTKSSTKLNSIQFNWNWIRPFSLKQTNWNWFQIQLITLLFYTVESVGNWNLRPDAQQNFAKHWPASWDQRSGKKFETMWLTRCEMWLTLLQMLHQRPIKHFLKKVTLTQLSHRHTQKVELSIRSFKATPLCSSMFESRTVNNAKNKQFNNQTVSLKTLICEKWPFWALLYTFSRQYLQNSPWRRGSKEHESKTIFRLPNKKLAPNGLSRQTRFCF